MVATNELLPTRPFSRHVFQFPRKRRRRPSSCCGSPGKLHLISSLPVSFPCIATPHTRIFSSYGYPCPYTSQASGSSTSYEDDDALPRRKIPATPLTRSSKGIWRRQKENTYTHGSWVGM